VAVEVQIKNTVKNTMELNPSSTYVFSDKDANLSQASVISWSVISWLLVSISGCWSSPTVESRDAVVGLEGRPDLPTTAIVSGDHNAVRSSVRLTSEGLRTTETICSPPNRLRLRVDPDVPGRLRADPDVPGRLHIDPDVPGRSEFGASTPGGGKERRERPWLSSEDCRALGTRDQAPSVKPEMNEGIGDVVFLSNAS